MKIKPLWDRVLVKRLEEQEEKTSGGIYIPDSAKEKSMEGIIVAVGTGRLTAEGKTEKLLVNEGDKILFSKYAGTEVKLNGEDHIIMKEDDILGVVQN